MTYKVVVNSGNNYTVKLSTLSQMAQSLKDLIDVEISGNYDKFVLMYDAASGKWRDVNPDEVLTASSTTETTQPGLPSDFINTLDVQLDNKIDLDAGEF